MNENITKGLKDMGSGIKVGARVDAGRLYPDKEVLAKIILRDFDVITATNYPAQWHGPKVYDLDHFNAWVNFGYENNLPLIMHMFAGPGHYFQKWIQDAKWNGPELMDLYFDYMRALMLTNDNYKKVYAWNVINEVFIAGGDGTYRDGEQCFLNLLGWEKDESGCTGEDKINDRHPIFVTKAFEFAGMYAKGKLELRDALFEFSPKMGHTRGMIQLIKHMRAKGIRCDAVGLQMHLYWKGDEEYDLDGFVENVKRIHDLGCEVYVTELDIGLFNNDHDTQSRRYEEVFKACRRAGVEQVHTWGVCDAIGHGWRHDEGAFLFDENYNEKPAYFAVANALKEKP